jgi:hypothetical protein
MGVLLSMRGSRLENVFALDEERLCGWLGYTIEELVGIPGMLQILMDVRLG